MISAFINSQGYNYSFSNVVEKCLNLGNNRQKKEIIDEILNKEDR